MTANELREMRVTFSDPGEFRRAQWLATEGRRQTLSENTEVC
jgi:hypothetical protein